MKKIKRAIAILLVMIVSFSVVSVGAEAVSVSLTNSDYGYMLPTNYNFTKRVSTVYLNGSYDYINFYINSENRETYFFYEIYSDKNCTKLVTGDYTYCANYGTYTYTPYVKLLSTFSTGTYYCVTYAAHIDDYDNVTVSKPSMESFKIVVNRNPSYSQNIVGLKSATNTVDGPKVSWYKLNNSTVKYNIYRRYLTGTQWVKVGTVNGSTYTFTDKSVKNKNGRYVYTVRGVDKNGTLTKYHYSGVTTHYAATPVVSSVSTVVDNKIQIKWNSVDKNAIYQLYRKENDGGWVLLERNVGGTTYYDTTAKSGNKYRYTVRARIYTDTGNALSSYYNGKEVTYIKAPGLNPLEFVENGMNITWKPAEGAVKYAVYRKNLDEKTNWRLIGKVDAENNSFIDTTALKDGGYLYTVRSEGANFQGSYIGKGVEYFNLAPPDFKVDVKDNKITLSWASVPYADSYEVYGKFANDDYGWHYLKNSKVCTYEIAPKTYTDVIFAVRSVRGNTKSAYKYSDKITIYPLIEPNYVVYKDYIRLYWNAAGVDSYNIYRKIASAPDSEYELIANTASTKYDDKTAQFDVAYEYLIRGVKNSIEQSTNLTSKIITKYSPEKYIKDFNSYVINRYSDHIGVMTYSNKLMFEQVMTPEGEKLKTSYYMLEKNKWNYVVSGKIVPYGMGKNSKAAIVAYDENGKTPIDALLKPVDCTKPSCPEFSINVKASAADISIGRFDDVKEYQLIEDKNNLNIKIEPFDSDKKVISIPFSTLKVKNDLCFTILITHQNGNTTERTCNYIDIHDTYPRLLAVSQSDKGNVVSWTFDGEWSYSNGDEFYIYRKAPGESNWKKIGQVDPYGYSRLQFWDSTAEAGVNYFYTVRVCNVKTGCYMSYYDTKGMQVGQIATPKLYSASNSDGGIKVTWEQNYAVKGYYVYRKTAGSGWTKLATINDPNNAYYTDKTAKSGVTYYYTVRSYNGSVLSGYYSTGVKCTKS